MASAIQPDNADIIYLGGDIEGIFKTLDGGQTWNQIYTEKLGEYWRGRGIELMEIFDIGFHPLNPDILYLCYDDMGFWRSDDRGFSFKRLDPRLDPEGGDFGDGGYDCVRTIVVDPQSGHLYIGRSGGDDDDADNGFAIGRVWKSENQGESWTLIGSPKNCKKKCSKPKSRLLSIHLERQRPAEFNLQLRYLFCAADGR